MKNLAVAQVEGAEVATEVLAQEIVAISAGVKRLRSGRLNDKALLILIQQAAPSKKRGRYSTGQPISLKTIQAVLDGMASLEATFLRKPDSKGGR